MQTIEAISGLFIGESDSLLLLQRTAQRTHSPNQWDIMGGDIQSGQTPEEVLHRDALDKLNISDVHVLRTATMVYPLAQALAMQRHIFVCTGNYLNIKTNPKSYSRHGWFSADKIPQMDLTHGAQTVYQIAFEK